MISVICCRETGGNGCGNGKHHMHIVWQQPQRVSVRESPEHIICAWKGGHRMDAQLTQNRYVQLIGRPGAVVADQGLIPAW